MSSDDVIGQVSAALRFAVPYIRPSWIVGYEGPEVRYSVIGSAEGPRRFPDLFDIDLGRVTKAHRAVARHVGVDAVLGLGALQIAVDQYVRPSTVRREEYVSAAADLVHRFRDQTPGLPGQLSLTSPHEVVRAVRSRLLDRFRVRPDFLRAHDYVVQETGMYSRTIFQVVEFLTLSRCVDGGLAVQMVLDMALRSAVWDSWEYDRAIQEFHQLDMSTDRSTAYWWWTRFWARVYLSCYGGNASVEQVVKCREILGTDELEEYGD